MQDYEVNTSVLFNTGFDNRECNDLMFDSMKDKIVKDITKAFEEDQILSEYISSDLKFTFSGYKVNVEYTFSCHDENEAEAESFSEYALKNIQGRLQENGYTIEKVTCVANEMDMEWLDRLEGMWFG